VRKSILFGTIIAIMILSISFTSRDVYAFTEDAKLTASDAAAGDFFGASVAVSGDTIVVGAGVCD